MNKQKTEEENLKILIVDDEYLVRMGLRETVEWEKYGFEIIGEASNSTEGYEKYKQLSPDIIITDIRMGDTSGLDLVEKINVENQNIEMVILSGYGQFDYAKKAYENGACAFLSKPVDNDELIKNMLNIKEKINSRIELTEKINKLTSQLPYLKNVFIKNWLENKISDKNTIVKKCSDYHITVPKDNFVIANLCIDSKQDLDDSQLNELNEIMLDTVERAIGEYNFNAFFTSINSCNVAIVIIRKQEYLDIDNFTTKDFLLYIQNEFKCSTKNTLTVAISKPHKKSDHVHIAYNESCYALKSKAVMGNNSYIDYSITCKHKVTNIFISNEDIDAIIKSVKEADYHKTMQIIGDFFHKVNENKNIDMENMKNIVSEMIVMVMRSIFKNNETMILIFGRVFQPYLEVQKYETISDIQKWVEQFFNKLYEDPNLYLEYTYHPEIQQAIAIVMKDYMKPLTVESVANELFLSQYYFMHLFKKEVGKTFNEFLTKRRIDVAIELIKTNQYKMYEICEFVGYKNTNYFAKIFKQVTGTSPRNYMKQSTYKKML